MSDRYITEYRTEIIDGQEVRIKVYAPSEDIPKKADREKEISLSLSGKRRKATILRFFSETVNAIDSIAKKIKISSGEVEFLLNDFRLRVKARINPKRKSSTCDKYEMFISLYEDKLTAIETAKKFNVSRQYVTRVNAELKSIRRKVINNHRF